MNDDCELDNGPEYGELEPCPGCGGEGIVITCCDDICVGQRSCMHGDGEDLCETCQGEGEV